ncbi:MAG: hypothetical protein ACR2PW_06165 [Gammaproteobacteria bacterium]
MPITNCPSSLPRIRQLVLAARNLPDIQQKLSCVLELGSGYEDDLSHFGLKNIVLPVGTDFLEIVSPTVELEQCAAGRLIKRAGGDMGYMVIVQVDDFNQASELWEKHRIRRIWEMDYHKFDAHAKAAHLHPKDVGGAILSIDQMTPVDSWMWGGHIDQWRTQGTQAAVSAIAGATLTCADPIQVAQQWQRALRNCSLEQKDDQQILQVGATTLTFCPQQEASAAQLNLQGDILLSGFALKADSSDRLSDIYKRAVEQGLPAEAPEETGDTVQTAFWVSGVRFSVSTGPA